MAQRSLGCDVAVVGAGLAGLAVATKLREAGLEPLVLEASERVGGRLLNEQLADGAVTEMGGQFVNPLGRRVAALATQLGVDSYLTYSEGDSLLETDGVPRRREDFEPAFERTAEADYERLVQFIGEVIQGMEPDAPWRHPDAERLEGLTLERWMAENGVSDAGRKMIRLMSASYWAIDPDELTMLHFAYCVATTKTGDLREFATSEIDSRRFVGGASELPKRLADSLGECLIQNAAVDRIDQDDRRVSVHCDTRRIEAQRCVVTVPPPLIAQIAFDPQLPADKAQFVQRTPMGNGIRATIVYGEPFWRDHGLSGHAVSLLGPLGHVYDNSPPTDTPGVLTGMLGGRRASEYARQPLAERRAQVIDQLVRLYGEQASDPQRYLEKIWVDEPWIRGAWSSNPVAGGWSALGHTPRMAHGRVHWAGAETALHWYGHMEGALESAERAASEVLAETR